MNTSAPAPHLVDDDGEAAIDFYQRALGPSTRPKTASR